MERLIKDVGDRLNAQVPALLWVDWDAGQLESPEDNYPVQFPCALMDILQATPTRGQRGVLRFTPILRVRVAMDIYEAYHIAGNVASPDRATAFNKLTLVKDVLKALHGFSGTYFSSLTLVDYSTEKRDDLLKVIALDFACTLDDYCAATLYNSKQFTNVGVTASLKDTVEIQGPGGVIVIN